MKKTLLLAFVLALLVPWATNAQQTSVTLGNWSGTTTSNYGFWGTYYKNAYSQTLYTSTDIGSSGYIRAITLDNRSTVSATFDSVFIYMGHTNKTTFSSTSDWVAANSLTLVYSGRPFEIPGTTGAFTVVLDNAFNYNGTDNLVIAVSHKATAYYLNNKLGYTSTTNTVLYRGSDSDASYGNYPGTATGT